MHLMIRRMFPRLASGFTSRQSLFLLPPCHLFTAQPQDTLTLGYKLWPCTFHSKWQEYAQKPFLHQLTVSPPHVQVLQIQPTAHENIWGQNSRKFQKPNLNLPCKYLYSIKCIVFTDMTEQLNFKAELKCHCIHNCLHSI